MNSVYQPFYPKWYARLTLNSQHYFLNLLLVWEIIPLLLLRLKVDTYTLTNDAEASTDILKYTRQFFLIWCIKNNTKLHYTKSLVHRIVLDKDNEILKILLLTQEFI